MMYYQSIDDISLWNWRKAMSGEVDRLRLNADEGTEENDNAAWETLYDTYLAKFGLGKEYERVLELKIQIADLQCDYVTSGTVFMLNKIQMLQNELEEILNRPSSGSVDECLMYLSKWLKFRLDQKVISVTEFYTYLEGYKKEAEELKKLNKSKNG